MQESEDFLQPANIRSTREVCSGSLMQKPASAGFFMDFGANFPEVRANFREVCYAIFVIVINKLC